MKHQKYFYWLLLLALVSALGGFSIGYERGTNDAKIFVLERVGK